ncbi:unnamed protein product [Arabis nemorensis]|uniref:Uncharacterized protein n=1 Tax=Arabis nemorensis TaxID=586526 RepID=A0A565CDG8_9BRAS|nr:unnamed protein product [Arabis nemorensis]
MSEPASQEGVLGRSFRYMGETKELSLHGSFDLLTQRQMLAWKERSYSAYSSFQTEQRTA